MDQTCGTRRASDEGGPNPELDHDVPLLTFRVSLDKVIWNEWKHCAGFSFKMTFLNLCFTVEKHLIALIVVASKWCYYDLCYRVLRFFSSLNNHILVFCSFDKFYELFLRLADFCLNISFSCCCFVFLNMNPHFLLMDGVLQQIPSRKV